MCQISGIRWSALSSTKVSLLTTTAGTMRMGTVRMSGKRESAGDGEGLAVGTNRLSTRFSQGACWD